jgi:hypothetical protein
VDGRGDLGANERQARLEELGEDQQQLLELGREMAEALGSAPTSESEPTIPEAQDQP